MSVRSIIAGAVAVLSLSVSTFAASPFGLYASFQGAHSTGTMMGGLRYSATSDICLDLAVGAKAGYDSSVAGNGFTVYADAFFVGQTIGIGVQLQSFGGADLAITPMLMYALEKPINDNIAVGISPTILSYTFQKDVKNGIDILSGFNIYGVVFW